MERSEQLRRFRRVQRIADVMDSRFNIFGIVIGFDALIGLVPGVGDIIGGLISLYIVWEARQIGVPETTLNAMLMAVLFDVFLGSIPVFGDLFDVFYKVNRQNVARIETFLSYEQDRL